MDVALAVYNCLVNGWNKPQIIDIADFLADDYTEPDFFADDLYEYPESNLPSVTWRLDEFDPKSPGTQVLIESFPIRSIWVTRGIYRIEHKVRITLYQKLIHYSPSRISEYKTDWFKVKTEIDRILAINKFNIANISNLNLTGGWNDGPSIAVGRGVKTINEPIIWKSEQVITTVYYTNKILEEEVS